MAEPESGDDATLSRRHRRHHRNRQTRRRALRVVGMATAAVALVAGVAIALLASDVLAPSGDTKPSTAGTVAATLAPATSTTTPTGATCRALTANDPLRLWVGGDSLAGSLGPALGDMAGATGVVQPYFDSRVSSGLDNPGFFDWPDHATSEMARLDPEVVVFVIGTNDWSAVGDSGWKADYAKRVDEMLRILVGNGRTVYWVGAPVLRDQQKDDAVKQVNAVASEAVKRYQTATYFDQHALFADSDGSFTLNHADDTGQVVTMRAGDGVHLTVDGAKYLAHHLYALVDKQCHVDAQKVAGAAKHTIETEGSTQVAPSVTGAASSSGSSSNTLQTTPPATAAPTTTTSPAPPTTAPATTTPAPTTTTSPTITVPKPLGARTGGPPR
jgi:hypothetical protein